MERTKSNQFNHNNTIQFSINFREKIDNGTYEVTNRRGDNVEIIRWNLKGPWPIGFIARNEKCEIMGCATNEGRIKDSIQQDILDLFVILPKNEIIINKYAGLIDTLSYMDDETIDIIFSAAKADDEVCVKKNDAKDNNINNNGYEYVDLGLPSGTLWATCNLGASAPEEYGGYYAWGETSEKTVYDWDTYAFGNYENLKKYNTTDGRTVLELADDVAHVVRGGGWHIPTDAQLKELANNTTGEWTMLNGVNGRRFTSKTNGNSIFIPAAGYRWANFINDVGVDCFLWGSSFNSMYVSYAADMYSHESGVDFYGSSRYRGFSIRAVLDQK